MNKELSKGDLAAVVVLGLLIGVTFWHILTLQQTFFGRDYTTVQLSLKIEAFSAIKRGVLPLWTENVFAGFPFLASGEHGLFYPLSLLFVLGSTAKMLNFFFILHLFLPAFFTYLLLRKYRVGKVAALTASALIPAFLKVISFEASVISATIWFPMLFYTGEALWRRQTFAAALPLAVVEAMLFLTGHQQYFYILNLPFLFYLLLFSFFSHSSSTFRRNARGWSFLAAAVCLGIGLGAVQWLPQYRLYLSSVRYPSLPYREAAGAPLPASSLRILLFPYALWESIHTHSVVPLAKNIAVTALLFFLLIGCFKGGKNRWRAASFAFVLLFLMMLIFHFPEPLYWLFYTLLPAFKSMRGSDKFSQAAIFVFVLLNAFSLDAILAWNSLRESPKGRKTFSWLLCLLFWGVAILGLRPQRILSGEKYSLAELSFMDGVLFEKGEEFYFKVPFSFYRHVPFVQFLKERMGRERFVNDDWMKGPLKPNQNLMYGLPLFDGHFPLMSRQFYSLFLIDSQPDPLGYLNRNIANLGAVRYLVASEPHRIKNTRLVFQGRGVYIYENLEALPAALMVGRVMVLKDEQKLVKRLRSRSFHPERVVLLSEKPSKYEPQDIHPEDVRIRWQRSQAPQTIALEVRTKKTGFLVLSRAYDEEWQAWDNGKKVSIMPADAYFQALYLEKGTHQLEMRYKPLSFQHGFLISTLLLGALLLWLVTVFLL